MRMVWRSFLGFKFGFIGLFSGGVLPLLGQGSKGDAVPLGKKKGWPAVSGAALSALTRGGSRKKIGYNEKHTEQENH